MSWTLTVSGHKDFPEGEHHKQEVERNEALVVAEVEAMIPEIVSRLKGHGLSTIYFHGNEVQKHIRPYNPTHGSE